MSVISQHLSTGIKKPLLNQFSRKKSLAELDSLKLYPLVLPAYSLHTQSCERAVKMVTDAAESVYGWSKRDDFVRTQMRNREIMPTLKSKKDYLKGFNAQQE